MPLPASCSGSPREAERSPRVRRCSFPRAPPDLPVRVSAWLSSVPVHCRVTPPHRPSIRFLFVGSELCFRLPSHPASRRRSCLPLTVPANRPVEDFHLLDQRHAWRTATKGASLATGALCLNRENL